MSVMLPPVRVRRLPEDTEGRNTQGREKLRREGMPDGRLRMGHAENAILLYGLPRGEV